MDPIKELFKNFQTEGLAIIDKRRVSPEKSEAIHILGEVKDMNAVIVDDIVATGGSLIEAVEALHKAGAVIFVRQSLTAFFPGRQSS